MKTTRMNAALILAGVCVLAFVYTAAGQEWNYPTPDPDRDVRDITFYQPAEPQPLPAIRSERPLRIIFCIGDGMGFSQVTFARSRAVGSGGKLYMEQMPVSGAVRTYSADNVITDSAAAATALACGVKTLNGHIGVTPDKQPHASILERLDQKGWRTGLVATSAITHATPAGFASHVPNRGMEQEIAAQMLLGGIDVLLGGGRAFWISENGLRKDGRDLIAEAAGAGFQIAYTREQMQDLRPGPVLGLFADKEMTTFSPEPSLPQLARKAIELLSAESDDWFAPEPRFFLMIEGSQIDWACHDNNADNLVRQLLLFDQAVKEALDFAAKDKRTLVIVTADHETGGLTLAKEKDSNSLRARWSTKDHTGSDVPLYAFGPGAGEFSGALDNTDLFGKLVRLARLEQKEAAGQPERFLKVRR